MNDLVRIIRKWRKDEDHQNITMNQIQITTIQI